MIKVVPLVAVVEGQGEENAVRILIQRVFAQYRPDAYPDVKDVIRRKRQKLVKVPELENAIALAAMRLGGTPGGILVLIDADDDCPAELGPALLARAQKAQSNVPIGVVIAMMEYEAWFLAAASSLAGYKGLPAPLDPPQQPESIRAAKGWLEARMGGVGYNPVLHQPAFTQRMDLDQARTASSMDKLCRDLDRLATAIP